MLKIRIGKSEILSGESLPEASSFPKLKHIYSVQKCPRYHQSPVQVAATSGTRGSRFFNPRRCCQPCGLFRHSADNSRGSSAAGFRQRLLPGHWARCPLGGAREPPTVPAGGKRYRNQVRALRELFCFCFCFAGGGDVFFLFPSSSRGCVRFFFYLVCFAAIKRELLFVNYWTLKVIMN